MFIVRSLPPGCDEPRLPQLWCPVGLFSHTGPWLLGTTNLILSLWAVLISGVAGFSRVMPEMVLALQGASL